MLDKLLLEQLNKFIEENYESNAFDGMDCMVVRCCENLPVDLRPEPSFSEKVLSIIRKRDLDEIEVYKRAGLSRQSFSSIRSNPQYKPHKMTAMAMCIGLQLDISDSENLLNSAGYAFSHSSILDLIVEFFIINKRYDLVEINNELYSHNQKVFPIN